jgi:hypothetical protein
LEAVPEAVVAEVAEAATMGSMRKGGVDSKDMAEDPLLLLLLSRDSR